MGTEPAGRILLAHKIGIAVENVSERELIERAKNDPEAFGHLYEANYSRILNYIYRRTLNVAVAEELTSNTFFKVLRALPKYRPQAPFRAWLYRIATNEIKMHRRWERRRRSRDQDPHWQEELEHIYFSSREMEADDGREEKMRRYFRLHQSLGALPERYQTVLVLRYFEGLSYNEIAKVLGKSVGTVKSLVHRGLKRLKRLIGEKDATFP